MPKFQVYNDSAGKFRFRLRADNNKIVAVGEAYENYRGCINGVKSVQKNCKAQIEDATVEGPRIANPKFQVYKDSSGQFRFHLFARNGEIIADSEGYETKDACLNGVNVVGESGDAKIDDLTKSPDSTSTKEENTLSVSEKKPSTVSSPIPVIETETPSVNMDESKGIVSKKDQMLDELKLIRAALDKPAPAAPEPPKGLWNEFKDFLSKYKILGLAVAFVLGLYLGALVQALVKDFVIPLLGLAIPGMDDLATFAVTVVNQVFGIGDFLVALITFIIVAFIVFLLVKVAKKWKID